jgi:predicted MPP superfamily phosphohydrolase
MRFILGTIGVMFLLDAIWLVASVRLAKPIVLRVAVALFGLGQLCALAWLLGCRFAHDSAALIPKFVHTTLFIWHMIILPLVIIGAVAALPVLIVIAVIGLFRRRGKGQKRDENAISRRQFIAVAVVITPPLLNLSLASIAMRQLEQFRVRRFRLTVSNLPPDLHGLTIAQVSDMHVGRFTSGRVLRKIVAATNDLRVDLILLTGDLINDALADLDQGLTLVRGMQGRTGTYLIEGNHDLIENGHEFERRVRESGIPFLLDESAMLEVRGAPLQLLGLSWTRARENRDAAIASAVQRLLALRQPEAFSILLAHHPHAFDSAAAESVPLVLSGHTHGGQLMLNEQLGFGPALFRYWSGLYRKGASQLIVSNGVGNWFPLRLRAPAEIVHITLLRF